MKKIALISLLTVLLAGGPIASAPTVLAEEGAADIEFSEDYGMKQAVEPEPESTTYDDSAEFVLDPGHPDSLEYNEGLQENEIEPEAVIIDKQRRIRN